MKIILDKSLEALGVEHVVIGIARNVTLFEEYASKHVCIVTNTSLYLGFISVS